MFESTLSRSEIKQHAKDSLRGNWGIAIIVTVIYYAITSALGFIPPLLLVIIPPLTVGMCILSLNATRGNGVELENLFDGFKLFGLSVKAYLLTFLYIFAWSLIPLALAILLAATATLGLSSMNLILIPLIIIGAIPAMIAQLDYSLVYFIIADNPTFTATEALKLSKSMMRGHRIELIVFGLSFIGWAILCIFTLFIGYLWLLPYYFVSFAGFYEQLKDPSSTASARHTAHQSSPESLQF